MPARTPTRETFQLIADRFKALGEPARLQLLHALRSGPRTVTELVDETHLGQTNVSKHLALLRGTDLVVRQRVGSFVYYDIADPRLYAVCDLMCDRVRAEAVAQPVVA